MFEPYMKDTKQKTTTNSSISGTKEAENSLHLMKSRNESNN